MPKVEINSPAPDFSLEDYQGKQISLKDYQEKNVILVFNRSFL
jgi:peroxiredoxin